MSDTWYELKCDAVSEITQRLHQDRTVTYDDVYEIADRLVPVYTADLLNVALSNLYLATEAPEI